MCQKTAAKSRQNGGVSSAGLRAGGDFSAPAGESRGALDDAFDQPYEILSHSGLK
jgi:hypothetical protein